MAFVEGNSLVGRDNIASGSPTGRENIVGTGRAPLEAKEVPYLGESVSTTISRSGTTATASATAHGLSVGNIVRIAGAVQGAYNGDHRVATASDANTYTFTVYGSPTSPATGTITSRKVHQEVIPD